MNKHPPNLQRVLDYAARTAADPGIGELTRLTCQRFLNDLKDPRFELRPALPEFCISLMTGLFSFSQGERIDGTPLRGKPLELMDWHLFCTYAICGFFWKDTGIRRFTEADIFAPRKTVKTTWAEALQTALAMPNISANTFKVLSLGTVLPLTYWLTWLFPSFIPFSSAARIISICFIFLFFIDCRNL